MGAQVIRKERMQETYKGIPKYIKVGRTRQYNPEFIKLWEPYLDEGMALQHVAEIFGVTKYAVGRYYPGRGWDNRDCLALGTYMKHHNQKLKKLGLVKSYS